MLRFCRPYQAYRLVFMASSIGSMVAVTALLLWNKLAWGATPPTASTKSAKPIPTPPTPPTASVDVSRQLTLRLSLKQTDTGPAIVTLYNHGKNAVRLMQPHGLNPSAQFFVELRDSGANGEVVQAPPGAWCDMTNPLVSSDFILLAPGEQVQLQINSSLFHYKLKEGKRYRVTVRYVSKPNLPAIEDANRRGLGIWSEDPELLKTYRATMACDISSNAVTVDSHLVEVNDK